MCEEELRGLPQPWAAAALLKVGACFSSMGRAGSVPLHYAELDAEGDLSIQAF